MSQPAETSPVLPAGLQVTVEDAPSRFDRKIIDEALETFNDRFITGRSERLGVFVRDDGGKILAGLDAVVRVQWMFVENLWVDESLRGRGVGRHLMARAEAAALARGCHSAWLDTMSFQAPDFYRKLGYTIFATLDY